jgi:hypothetical protein
MAVEPSRTKTQFPSMRLSVTIDEAQYQAVQKQLRSVPNGAAIALSTAINKTLRSERTAISRRIAGVMTAKKTSIDKRINVRKATRSNLSGMIRIRGDIGVSLIGFGARQTQSGVTARIFGQTKTFPGMFIARGINNANVNGPSEQGNKLVFERFGEKRAMTTGRYGPSSIFGKYQTGPKQGQRILRQPIKAVYGPSVADTFEKTPGIRDQSLTDVENNLNKNIRSQISWLLNRGSPDATGKA